MIGIVMGSKSDLDTMRHAAEALEAVAVPYEMHVISAHRRPDATMEYARTAKARGLSALIAGAGGAAHLPGVLAACTTLPVLGVPMPGSSLAGADSLYSIVQMPRGIPVATFAIGKAGAANAGLFAAAMLALSSPEIAARLERFREQLRADVTADDDKLQDVLQKRAPGAALADLLAKV